MTTLNQLVLQKESPISPIFPSPKDEDEDGQTKEGLDCSAAEASVARSLATCTGKHPCVILQSLPGRGSAKQTNKTVRNIIATCEPWLPLK